ncbi:hypothetical protein V1281_001597 [Nitrobacteraceae bacterium AZCC 2161]
MSEVADVEPIDLPPSPTSAPKRAAREKKPARKPLPLRVQNFVWARAAGRCHFCNKLLIGDEISGTRNANSAYIAHIVADSPDGPRGDRNRSPLLAQDPDNLMLVCDTHHRVFDDRHPDLIAEYTEARLQAVKQRHEARIRIVTEIDESRATHVVRYAARIGDNESPVAKNAVKFAMLPDAYPLDDGWIDLDLATLDIADHEPEFWSIQLRNLRNGYRERVRGRMERQEIHRLAVFALGPIPLLFELGRLVSDISTVEVRQFLRDPKGWKWDPNTAAVKFETTRSIGRDIPVALKLEISAQITDDRVQSVLGNEAAIWSIAAVNAHNDIMRRPEDLAAFAKLFRNTLDDIKVIHGENVVINVFPAVPVSVAVEAGRAWQPKAHPPLKIYDQNRKLGGFIPAHNLEQPD